MVKPVEETRRTYEVTLDNDNVVVITAVSCNSSFEYYYEIEDAESTVFSVNDTKYLIDALNAATDWINENSENSE